MLRPRATRHPRSRWPAGSLPWQGARTVSAAVRLVDDLRPRWPRLERRGAERQRAPSSSSADRAPGHGRAQLVDAHGRPAGGGRSATAATARRMASAVTAWARAGPASGATPLAKERESTVADPARREVPGLGAAAPGPGCPRSTRPCPGAADTARTPLTPAGADRSWPTPWSSACTGAGPREQVPVEGPGRHLRRRPARAPAPAPTTRPVCSVRRRPRRLGTPPARPTALQRRGHRAAQCLARRLYATPTPATAGRDGYPPAASAAAGLRRSCSAAATAPLHPLVDAPIRHLDHVRTTPEMARPPNATGRACPNAATHQAATSSDVRVVGTGPARRCDRAPLRCHPRLHPHHPCYPARPHVPPAQRPGNRARARTRRLEQRARSSQAVAVVEVGRSGPGHSAVEPPDPTTGVPSREAMALELRVAGGPTPGRAAARPVRAGPLLIAILVLAGLVGPGSILHSAPRCC